METEDATITAGAFWTILSINLDPEMDILKTGWHWASGWRLRAGAGSFGFQPSGRSCMYCSLGHVHASTRSSFDLFKKEIQYTFNFIQ